MTFKQATLHEQVYTVFWRLSAFKQATLHEQVFHLARCVTMLVFASVLCPVVKSSSLRLSLSISVSPCLVLAMPVARSDGVSSVIRFSQKSESTSRPPRPAPLGGLCDWLQFVVETRQSH